AWNLLPPLSPVSPQHKAKAVNRQRRQRAPIGRTVNELGVTEDVAKSQRNFLCNVQEDVFVDFNHQELVDFYNK
ncbi:hypothetical protein KUCAC02_029036, partial [Chaenocephalus aceratus]